LTYIPVEKDGDIFVVSREWIRSDLPFPTGPEIKPLLNVLSSYVLGKVRYGGNTHVARIYGDDDDDLKYALLLERPALSDDFSVDEVSLYAASLYRICMFTEYVLPEQRADLDQDFIEPNLVAQSGRGVRKYHWSELKTAARVLIVGAAGAGKTTLVRRWMREEVRRLASAPGASLPVYIALRNWRADGRLAVLCQREIASLGGAALASNFEQLASEGRVTLALDGLDEVPHDRRQSAFDAINEFATLYSECSLVVTTRWGTQPENLANFLNVELAPFESKQINEFAYHKLYDSKRWAQFSSRLKSEHQLSEVAGNPLLLTLLIARYARNEISPSYISDALNAIVRILSDEWDSVRGVVRWLEAPPSANRREMVLRIIAAHVSETNRNFFDASEIDVHLRRASIDTSSSILLKFLEESTSIVRQRADDKWEFRYGVIQEFLSAVFWLERLASKVDEMVKALISKPSASLTRRFRFLSGLASDATEPIQKVLEHSGVRSAETAVALSEAMTQRLLIDPEVAAGYGQYTCKVLESLLEDCSIEVGQHSGKSNQVWALAVKKAAGSMEWTEQLPALLGVLHRMREGSGGKAIESAFAGSRNELVREIAGLLKAEGELHVSVGHDEHEVSVRAEVTRSL
jgi:NACHT domain